MGGRGIGRAMALALARQGARVGVAARSTSELDETVATIQEGGGQAIDLPMDVTDHPGVEASVDSLLSRWGRIDLLVNNAGSNRVVAPVWETDPAAWWYDVDVNLRGPFLCARAVLPSMISRGSGRIVNVVSGTAGRPFPYNSAYAVSKAALVRFSDSLAAETWDHGVAVFALRPGNVDTRLSRELAASESARRWLGRTLSGISPVSPQRAADAVVLLAQGHADHLSGRWFDATEDIAAVIARSDEVLADDLYQLRRRTIRETLDRDGPEGS